MKQKAVYQLSARQIILLGLVTAFAAVGLVLFFNNISGLTNAFQIEKNQSIAFAEKPAAGISNPSAVSDEQNNIEVYKSFSPGVAFITTSERVENFYGQEFEKESGNGSGSVIDNRGHILTNYHVVEGSSKLTVSLGGKNVYPATYIGGDPDTDLAVIKITPPREGLTIVPLGDSDDLNVGQKVLAIGNPFGLDRTLTTGVISGLQRPIRARNNRPIDAAIQTDASINPGNSGGPLLNKFGQMIGINSQILSPSGASAGVGFAIPVNTAKRIIPQLIQFGQVNRPKLGATFLNVEELNERGIDLPIGKGLLIRNVLDGSSIDRAGIRGLSRDKNGIILGDIVQSIDNVELSDIDDLYRYLDKKKIGETVNLKVFREGKTLSIPVKLLPIPDSSQPSRNR
ncbi:MAG: S1C family serine protease [Aridibacter sp.]